MINFTRKKGKVVSVKSVNDLFSSDKRKIRIELFGSYLSKSFVLETVLTNADNNIKELGNQLANLKLLKDELEKQIAEKKTKKMLEDVEKMSEADAQALFDQLKVKLGQQ